jgi:hypothetical protein
MIVICGDSNNKIKKEIIILELRVLLCQRLAYTHNPLLLFTTGLTIGIDIDTI